MSYSLPQSDSGEVMQLVPAYEGTVTYDASVSSETELTLNSRTKLVEINAIDAPILMKYKESAGGTAVSTSNFSEVIQVGQTRHFAIPVDITVLAFIELASGATLIAIEK